MGDYMLHVALSNYMAQRAEKDVADKLTLLAKSIANRLNISVEDMQSKNRRKDIVEARQLFCYFARSKFDISLQDIGAYMNRDRTTVMHALAALKDKIDTDYNDINNTIKKLQWCYMMES